METSGMEYGKCLSCGQLGDKKRVDMSNWIVEKCLKDGWVYVCKGLHCPQAVSVIEVNGQKEAQSLFE